MRNWALFLGLNNSRGTNQTGRKHQEAHNRLPKPGGASLALCLYNCCYLRHSTLVISFSFWVHPARFKTVRRPAGQPNGDMPTRKISTRGLPVECVLQTSLILYSAPVSAVY